MGVAIDGSMGEGGGQVLRTSLTLAMCTRRPLRIFRIRARRPKPGLMPQHLVAVRAAAEVSGARIEGAQPGSGELRFIPGEVRGGDYFFDIGTAGSTTLVAQTVLPALLTAPHPSTLILEGGTHNVLAPPFDFFDRTFLPMINRMGPKVTARLERYGFYPAGGGRIVIQILPVPYLAPLHLMQRGGSVARRAVAILSRLPARIGERELAVVRKRLAISEEDTELRRVESRGPGNALLIECIFASLTEIFSGFGERGVTAERVAEEVAEAAREYLASTAAADRHLADQLQIPLALAGAGSFTTLTPTSHSLTNMEVIRRFLPLSMEFREHGAGVWRFQVSGGPC
jgi:RNA 3'-terminal phosphate cyclase (ATP)